MLLADGSHDAQVVRTSAASSVLAAAGVVTVGRVVAVRPVGRAGHLGAPELVVTDGVPSAAAPVVDGNGRAWVLLEGDVAVRVDRDGRVGKRVRVAPLVSALTVVDGDVYAVSPIAVRAVDRSATLEGAGDGGVVPSVGIATGGTWAVARGTNVALVHRGSTTDVDVGATVRALAIWHGDVWVATGDHLTRIHDGVVTPVPGLDTTTIGGELDIFGDGGRLWVVSPHAAVSIDRDQEPTVFTLAAVDVDLCVGDCSTQALLDYLGAAATSTAAGDCGDCGDRGTGALGRSPCRRTCRRRPRSACRRRRPDRRRRCHRRCRRPRIHAGGADHHRRGDPGHPDLAAPPTATSTTIAGPTTTRVEDTTTPRDHHDRTRRPAGDAAAGATGHPPAGDQCTEHRCARDQPADERHPGTDHRARWHGAAVATPGRRRHPGPRVDRWRRTDRRRRRRGRDVGGAGDAGGVSGRDRRGGGGHTVVRRSRQRHLHAGHGGG